jgi:hypothetical protein
LSRFLKSALALLLLLAAWSPVISAQQDWIYRVQPGENLWTISMRYLGDMSQVNALRRHNDLHNSHAIAPGYPLKIPVKWMKSPSAQGRVIALAGNPSLVISGTNEPVLLLPGSRISIGDAVITNDHSSITVEFADGTRILVLPGSRISFEEIRKFGDSGMTDTRLRLQSGRVEVQAEPAKGPASRFEINTPAAVTSVRGTRFRIGEVSGKTLAETLEGRVEVAASGQATEVDAGLGLFVKPEQPPSDPIPLLPAPAVESRLKQNREVMNLAWTPVDGAVEYRVQIYDSGENAPLLIDKVSRSSTVELAAPADGNYRLLVRAIDVNQLEGFGAQSTLEVDARPLPPLLVELPDKALNLANQPIIFDWTGLGGAKMYDLRIAMQESPGHPVFESNRIEAEQFSLEPGLPPGDYQWQIASRSETGDTGPYSDAQTFSVLLKPSLPTGLEASIDEEGIRMQWLPVDGAAKYHVQMSRSRKFETVHTEQIVESNFVILPKPDYDKYYLRVRGLGERGLAGAFSEPDKLKIRRPSRLPQGLMGAGLLLIL